jgi:hypothetical protein
MKTNANWAWSGGITQPDDDPLDGIAVGRSSYPIPRTRPAKPVLIDLTEFNAGTAKARHAYAAHMTELDPATAAPVYDRRVEHALANQRYRARKAAER